MGGCGVQVAIKWINVHVDSRAHEAGRGGLSSAQRWALLSAEVSTMKRLRDSLQGPVPVRAGYPVAPPADGRLEEANVVIYLTVHASDLSMAAIRSLEDPEPTKLVQARPQRWPRTPSRRPCVSRAHARLTLALSTAAARRCPLRR